MSQGIRRRLAAIVSADVVGYSRLMGVDEAGTLAAMKAHRRELWTPTIERFGGRVVGSAGDSILVEYASAVAAVESSLVVQSGMVKRNAELPDDRRMSRTRGFIVPVLAPLLAACPSQPIPASGRLLGEDVQTTADSELARYYLED